MYAREKRGQTKKTNGDSNKKQNREKSADENECNREKA